jgi:hypothetical protein
MNDQHWTVWRPTGEEWGHIRRLVIDPSTKQIGSADVILTDTGRFVRVPWETFEIADQRIILTGTGQVSMIMLGASGCGLSESPTLEVATR